MKKENILYGLIVLLIGIVIFQGYLLYDDNKKVSSPEKHVSKSVIEKNNRIKDISKFYSSNPFEEFQKLQAEMEKAFNSMNSQFAMIPEFEDFFKDVTVSPSLNMKNLEDRYEIKVNIPGSDRNSINIITHNGILRVESKTEKKVDEKGDTFIKKEIYSGRFLREMPLPEDAKSDDIKSSYKDGVLTIIIPKQRK